jgi:hypothetical protein
MREPYQQRASSVTIAQVSRSVLVLLLTGCLNNEDIPAPAITTISPAHGAPGIIVSISGDHFCQQPESEESDPLACLNVGSVEFGLVPATIASYAEHSITCEVPAIASGKVDVSLAVHARRSSSITFVVEGP